MEEHPVRDHRLDFLADCVLRTLKVKRDQWQKLVSGEDELRLLRGFLDGAEPRSLLLWLTAAGLMRPATRFEAADSLRDRAVYFVKRRAAALGPRPMTESLVCGQLSGEPLEQLSALVEEVRAAGRSDRPGVGWWCSWWGQG